MEGKFYGIKRKNLQIGVQTYKKVKKIDLYAALSFLLEKKKDLGLDISKLPDKQWMLDILFFLEHQNKLFNFKGEETEN